MAHIQADRVKETTSTTGTGNVTLAGAVTGFRAFASVCANSDTVFYCIAAQSGSEWEVGLGTFVSATPALARTTVLASSNAGSLVNFSAGTKDVFITVIAQRLFLPYLAAAPAAPSSGMVIYSKDRLGIPMPSVLGPTGVERTLAQDSLLVVRNETGSSIPAFSPVYSSGTGSSAEPLVALADADSETTMPVIGVTLDAIGNNSNGLILREGIITGINTSGFSVNDTIYCSQTAGAFTATEPTFPALSQKIGRILASHASAGAALVYQFPMRNDGRQGIVFSGIATPSTPPAAGDLYVYSRNRAGRMFLEAMGPSGIDYSFQPALFGNNVTMWLPGVGTTAAINFGVSFTVGATQAHPTIANTNFMTQLKRATYTTTTTAGNASGVRSASPICWRGSRANEGGFFFFARFGVLNHNAGFQHWVGLSALTGLLAGEPSAQNDTVCVGKDSSDTNWQIITRSGAAATKTDTGVAVAAGGTDNIFDVMFFCKPNDTKITARMVNVVTGAVIVNNVGLTTNLPTITSMLTAHAETRNGAVAAASAIFLNRIYVESDT